MAGRVGCGDERLSRSTPLRAIGWVPVVFGLGCFLLPLGNVVLAVARAIGGTQALAFETRLRASLELAVAAAGQAATSALLTLLVALPLTYLLARRQFRGRRLLAAVVSVPFMLPTVVTGLALRQLVPLEPGLALLLIGHVYVNLAVVQRIVGPVWGALDGRLLTAASSLGATPVQVLRSITLPLLRPAITRAAAIVFAYTFGSLGLVLILGGRSRTLETQLLRQVSLLLDFPGAALTAVLQLLVVGLVLGLAARGRVRHASLDQRRAIADRKPLRGGGWLATGLTTLLLLPVLGLLATSFRGAEGWTLQWWQDAWSQLPVPGVQPATAALLGTVRAAISTALLSAGLAVAVGIAGLHGGWRWLGRASALPLAISSTTLGLGLLLTFGREPLDWRGSWWLLPLAHTLAALPLTTALTVPLFHAVDARRAVVAASLGAHPLRAFVTAYGRVTLRAAAHAGALGAAVSIGEFGAASFLGAYDLITLPVAIMRLLAHPGAQSAGVAAVMALLLTVVAAVLVALVERLEGSRT